MPSSSRSGPLMESAPQPGDRPAPAFAVRESTPLRWEDSAHMDFVRTVAWAVPAGARPLLVTGSDEGVVQVWDVRRGELVRTLGRHADGVIAAASVTLPAGQVVIATAGKDREIRLWDLTGGRLLHRLAGHAGAVNAVAWVILHDGRVLLASGGDDATVRVWDGVSGRELHRMPVGHDHVDLVWSVSWAVLPTGDVRLAAAVDDAEGAGAVHLWDGLTGAPLRTLTAPASPASRSGISRRSVCLEPGWDDQMLVATNLGERAIQVWDATTGKSLYKRASDSDVGFLAWTYVSGRLVLLAIGGDRVVKIDPGGEPGFAAIDIGADLHLSGSAVTRIPGGPTLMAMVTERGWSGSVEIWRIGGDAGDAGDISEVGTLDDGAAPLSVTDAGAGAGIDVDVDLLHDLARRIGERVEAYRRHDDAAALFGPEVERHAALLWEIVRTHDEPAISTDVHELRLAAAATLCWLHCMRQDVIRGEGGLPSLARAVLCSAWYPEAAGSMPSAMDRLVGPAAEAGEQAAFGVGLLMGSQKLSDPALLDAGIVLLTAATGALPDRDPDRIPAYSNLCLALRNRYRRDGRVDDLTASIAAGELAVAGLRTPAQDPVAARSHLAAAYRDRFELDRDPDDIRRAVVQLEELAAWFEPGPKRSEWLSEVAHTRLQQYALSDDPADLRRSSEAAEEAVRALPADLGEAVSALFAMAAVLRARYQRTAAREHLVQAMELVERCLELLPPGHPLRSRYAADTALFFLECHIHGQGPDSLSRAASLSEEAVAAHPADARAVTALVTVLQERCRFTGDGADLDRAIRLAGQAAASSDERLKLEEVLAGAHLARFQHAGALDDMDQAIDLWRGLLLKEGGGLAHQAGLASLLCSAYQQRSIAAQDLDDLNRAIEFGEASVGSGVMRADSGLGQRLGRLALAYAWGHEIGRDAGDRSRAIELGEMAVKATPRGNVERAGWMANLADAYLSPGTAGAPAGDEIDRAVELSRQALAACPETDVSRVRVAGRLAAALRVRILSGGERVDAPQLRALAQVVRDARAIRVDQVWGRHAVGTLALITGETKLAVELLDEAVALLPGVAGADMELVDRQRRLGAHQGLVGAVFAAHCAAGDPAGAVEAVERGRALLFANREDTGAVAAGPRFARSFAELSDAAVGGAVVVVGAGPEHGDAVIVRAGCPPLHVELPALREDGVRDRAMSLGESTAADDGLAAQLRRQRVVPEILGWLWEAVAAPVLAALPPGDSLHRIWWLPIGHLGVFPLHAAERAGKAGVLDAAVSSYIPTIGALADTRARAAATSHRQLVAALHRTPDLPDLPGTVQEAEDLHVRHPGVMLADEQATAERILAELADATWAHFACHAKADLISPASGGLRLHDRMLRLPEITALRLSEAELAYLSACSTGHHGGRYADEVLDLASAFHLAGYRHVIASLWPLGDRVGAQAAQHFYRQMPSTAAADTAAAVLRGVTLELRAAHPARPDLWAALIHSGV